MPFRATSSIVSGLKPNATVSKGKIRGILLLTNAAISRIMTRLIISRNVVAERSAKCTISFIVPLKRSATRLITPSGSAASSRLNPFQNLPNLPAIPVAKALTSSTRPSNHAATSLNIPSLLSNDRNIPPAGKRSSPASSRLAPVSGAAAPVIGSWPNTRQSILYPGILLTKSLTFSSSHSFAAFNPRSTYAAASLTTPLTASHASPSQER